MKRSTSWKLIAVAASCWPVAAFAYIDPGTGSILIQGLIAAVAAVGVTLKLYWHRFVGLFRRKRQDGRDAARPMQGNPRPQQEQLRP